MDNIIVTHKLVYADGALSVTGVKEVKEFSAEYIACALQNSGLYIEGKDLTITELDVEKGVLEVSGEVTSLRYGNGSAKESLLKRLFK